MAATTTTSSAPSAAAAAVGAAAAAAAAAWAADDDPYRELELYLEKAHEEIGQVFLNLQSSLADASQEDVRNVQKKSSSPPPVPPRRLLVKRPGLRISDAYINETPSGGFKIGSHKQLLVSQAPENERGGFAVAQRPQRRTSCPALKSQLDLSRPADENLLPNVRSQRRSKRFLTADLHTDGIGKLKSPYSTPAESSLNSWTTSLMAELNSVIENELQRLGCGRDQFAFDDDDVFASTNSSARTLCPDDNSARETLPPALVSSVPSVGDKHQCQQGPDMLPRVDAANLTQSDSVSRLPDKRQYQQLSADLDQTKRKIFNDLHLLETTCCVAQSGKNLKAPVSNGSSVSHSPVLRPNELQDFLRRVEDSIRTTCLDVTSDNPATKKIVYCDNQSSSLFDATTQTSPTSLSRSSSFLWVSDCNCSVDSGTLVEGGRMSSSSNATSLSVSAPLSISRRSLPATASEAEVQTEVNIDTSLSSLISGSSGLDCMDNIQFNLQITPESGTDVGYDHFDGGAESGIGTGSPPPKDRRKKSANTAEQKVFIDSESESSSSSSVDAEYREESDSKSRKRDKVRRRETWEKLRRRHSCKRVHSRRLKDKETVWIPRDSTAGATCLDDTLKSDKVLHKPPASSTPNPTAAARSKLKPLVFRHVTSTSTSSTWTSSLETPVLPEKTLQRSPVLRAASPGSIKTALQSVLAMEFTNKSNSVPLLREKNRKLKPVSAACTPTEPHITIETSLGGARSQSETAFAELEAAEATRWLRAAGFPQYAQMYEDLQFPVDLSVVERDHQFLDSDSLHALFRRLATLNRTARLKSDNRPRPQGDISEDDDQECALSDQWMFQRHSRRWSRIDDLLELPSGCLEANSADPEVVDGEPETPALDEADQSNNPAILGSFRRSSSERLRYGAKSLLRRMESLRSRSRRRMAKDDNSLHRNGIVISEPQVIDALDMQDRIKDLNCVRISPSGSETPSTTPSPDMNRSKGNFESLSATPSPCSSISSSTKTKSGSRKFFRKRQNNEDPHEPLSDSECSPTYWRKHSDSKDFWNTPETPSPTISRRKEFQRQMVSTESRSFRERFHLAFKQGFGKIASPLASPEEEDVTLSNSLAIPVSFPQNGITESSTPSGSLRIEADLVYPDSQESEESVSVSQSGKNCIRWHSLRRQVSVDVLKGPVHVSRLTVGQFALLRKLALLRLTALLERHTPATKPTWGWDLSKFIKRNKTPDYKGKAVFGVPLSVTLQRTGQSLPAPIVQALHYLRHSALDQVGIFRKSGVRSRIVKLREMCEAAGEKGVVDYTDQQAFDVADMVKQYFRDLPEALLTAKLSETFITIFQVVPMAYRLAALRFALLLLPDEHREALQTLLEFLVQVASTSSVNQMNASNLAVCLAPSLFHLNTGMASRSVSASPRRRKTVGVPDPRELSENKAAHECLLQMIKDYDQLFLVSDEMLSQCRFTCMEHSVPVSLEDLHTAEYGDWQAYMNGCMVALVKEIKERPKGWISVNSPDLDVDITWKKVDDGHPLRLWRVSVEVEAPPGEVLTRVLRERGLWDPSLLDWNIVKRPEKRSEIVHYVCSCQTPPMLTDFCVLRVWRNDLPRGTCLLVETSINDSEAPVSPSTSRGIVLVSRYLIEPCGAGKSRLVHLSRIDSCGRSPEWYNKNYGLLCAANISRIRDSFSHVAEGPESKV